MSILRPPINPLVYPAFAVEGVNSSHPASQALRFSGIASGGNFVSLNQGRKGTISGSPSFGIDGAMGPAFSALAGADRAAFSGQSTVNDLSMTQAAIVRFNSVAGTETIFSGSGANNGWRIYVTGGTFGIVAGSVIAVNSSITLVANTPYFVVASINGSTSNFLALDLSTGKILTATSSGATPAAPDGTYLVGNDAFNEPANAKISAAMFSARYTSLWEMRQWAQDPWAFWYPRPRMPAFATAAAGGSFLAAWARQSNLPVLGTGTY